MANAEHCLAMADEAERLAAIVSYGRDKTRLKQQADCWREKARAMEAARPEPHRGSETSPTMRGGVMAWLHRRGG